jgi:hypothetical protein
LDCHSHGTGGPGLSSVRQCKRDRHCISIVRSRDGARASGMAKAHRAAARKAPLGPRHRPGRWLQHPSRLIRRATHPALKLDSDHATGRWLERLATMVPKAEMATLLEWTRAKLADGEEPRSRWYQLMKLREALEAILIGMAATGAENSLQSEHGPGRHLRRAQSSTFSND